MKSKLKTTVTAVTATHSADLLQLLHLLWSADLLDITLYCSVYKIKDTAKQWYIRTARGRDYINCQHYYDPTLAGYSLDCGWVVIPQRLPLHKSFMLNSEAVLSLIYTMK